MKKLALALALVSAVGSLGCGTEVDLGNRPRFDDDYSLTVLAYDGITGEKITNAQATVRVGPYSFEADREGNAYTFNHMQYGTFPIFINAEGYLGFTSTNYTFTTKYDTKTVQLFKKQQTVEQDLNIKVYNGADGSPVVGGQVLVNISALASIYPDNRKLTGTFLEMPTVFVLPLTNGTATIPKEQLVFGATYEVDVIGARNTEDKYLTPIISTSASYTCKIGFDYHQINVFMGPVAETPMAISANNEVYDANVDSLVVTFPYPVELCGTATPSIGITPNYDHDGDGIVTAPAATPVAATLSQGDTVLTLKASFASHDTTGELAVTFNGISVQVKGTSGCTSLGSIRLRESGNVDTRIDMQDL